MAKFAELTEAKHGAPPRRVLVNPERIEIFLASQGSQPGCTRVDGGNWSIYVEETPDEVLRRLCFPEMPDAPPSVYGQRSAVGEILADIGRFRAKTEEVEHTDTGEAWELLDSIEDELKRLLG